jgi:hypothetical protein
MTDQELKKLLKQIDDKFEEIFPLLNKAGQGLADKVEKETGYRFDFSIGHPEAGINCICLQGPDDIKTPCFPNSHAARKYEDSKIYPLFSKLRYVYFSTWGGLYK